jgi:hypothetical protein
MQKMVASGSWGTTCDLPSLRGFGTMGTLRRSFISIRNRYSFKDKRAYALKVLLLLEANQVTLKGAPYKSVKDL